MKYLSRYTHRVAISNRRLLAADARSVTFSRKDYADGARRKTMTLAVEEFVRRFCLHRLPERFVKIRHYGLLGNAAGSTPGPGRTCHGPNCRTFAPALSALRSRRVGLGPGSAAGRTTMAAGDFDLRQLLKMKNINSCAGKSKRTATPLKAACRRARCQPATCRPKPAWLLRTRRALMDPEALFAGACLDDADSPAPARIGLRQGVHLRAEPAGRQRAGAGQKPSMPLEAKAAMKSIVRKDTGEDWKEYLRGLARAEGLENPTEENLRRLDRGRKDKKVSNEQWESRIARMKDGRTHLAYKVEHAVDVLTEAIVATTVTFADKSDARSGPVTLDLAAANLVLAGSATVLEEAVMDKAYHDNRLLTDLREQGVRTYIPERRQKSRCSTNKLAGYEEAFRANRRRVRGNKGRQLNRWRSERCERTFAHVCETGGGRRTWPRGQTNVNKAHTHKCAAYNLGLLLRKVWGLSKPLEWGAPFS